jgi:metallo-beta-lactamase class B
VIFKQNLLILLFILSTASVLIGSEGKTIELGKDLAITEVENGVYLVVDWIPFGRSRVPCNSLLVTTGPNTVIWCDTTCEPESTKLVYEWTIKNLGDINLIEINTGFHNDNLGGNEFLLAKGVPIYGSDITAKIVRERGREEKEKIVRTFADSDNTSYHRACRQMTFKPPDHTFEIEKGMVLTSGDETVEVYYPGPSHTIDNVVVYFQKRKVLFGGCMIKSLNAKNAGFTGDADMQQWPRSVEKLLSKYQDAKIVVPGHGACGDMKLIKHTIELLDKINNEAKK